MEYRQKKRRTIMHPVVRPHKSFQLSAFIPAGDVSACLSIRQTVRPTSIFNYIDSKLSVICVLYERWRQSLSGSQCVAYDDINISAETMLYLVCIFINRK